jgi:hypothetical protein
LTAKSRKPTRSEAEVSAQVVEAAAMLGIELRRRNVGAMANPKGQVVRFGEPGDGDHYGQIGFGPWRGALLEVEVKHEGFDPRKARGAARERFERQLAKLRRTNEAGGIGLWISDAGDFLSAMQKILAGCRVEFDDNGFPWLTDEPRKDERIS